MKAERTQRSSLLEELRRCLRWLVTLFPDPEFRAHPPEIVLDPGYPVSPMERDACIPLYRRDLGGSPTEILTILLHKAIHAFHAFRWQPDCTCWSYHTEAFRRQAEQVGFQVGWAGRRHGWAQTRPGSSLERFFEKISLATLSLATPLREWGRRPNWDCGLLRLPTRADLENRLGHDARSDSRRRLIHSLQVHRRGDSPMVRLSGRWLAAFGFAQGVRLKVEARPGRLVLEARPEVSR